MPQSTDHDYDNHEEDDDEDDDNKKPLIFHRKYSTTSSIYTNGTLTCPASRQQLLCVACIIQSQIYDAVCTPKTDNPFTYNEFILSSEEDEIITSTYEKIEAFEYLPGRSISEGKFV